ncbi:DUF1707 domain-containing protein [Nocardioides sp. InS609-2]|uniref:DUF1707 SHOCT-like domain-containing protein n=1 Tax=Nocardioides sp. InS609-2 TaxID=2760705 RepID=UPI0020C05201|nr:DUF1707 domain-containing protein [Nocardioides sp. InS609-2]
MATTDPWAAFEHDPRRAENSALRASDLDRDVVHRVLGEAYAEGRLDRDEFDQRSDSVTKARTLAELPEIMSDLVPSRAVVPAADRHEAAVAEYRSERRNALWGFLSASTICWVIWFATGMSFPWPLFVMLGTGLNLGRIAFERESRIAEEERRIEKRERKEIGQPEE